MVRGIFPFAHSEATYDRTAYYFSNCNVGALEQRPSDELIAFLKPGRVRGKGVAPPPPSADGKADNPRVRSGGRCPLLYTMSICGLVVNSKPQILTPPATVIVEQRSDRVEPGFALLSVG